MRDACVRALAAGLGRPPAPAEVRDIETRIRTHMRLLARKDPPAWSALPEAERLREAGKAAGEEIVAEQEARERALETRVLKMQATDAYMNEQIASGRDKLTLTAAERLLRDFKDGDDGQFLSADSRATGALKVAISQALDALDAAKQGIWSVLPFNDPSMDRALRRWNAGLDNPPKEIAQALKTLHEHIDLLRERLVAAGGRMGHLEDWREAQRWSQDKIARFIRRHGEGALVDLFVAGADRTRYFNIDGSAMSDAELRDFMSEALRSVRFDGANQRQAARARSSSPSPFVSPSMAGRGAAHRQIHLTPEAQVRLLTQFSEYGFMESMVQHLRSMSRHVAMMETFGPEYARDFEAMVKAASDRDITAGLIEPALAAQRSQNLMNLFEHVAGLTYFQGSPRLAAVGATIRSVQAGLHLGFAKFSSFTDIPNMYYVAATRGLDAGRLWVEEAAAYTGQGRRWAKRMGLLTDTVMSQADRYGYDNFNVRDAGARVASFTMKTTGLNWDTEGRRQGYGVLMMDSFGHLTRQYRDMSAMHADDVALAKYLNIDQATWDVWRLAKLEHRGQRHTLLTIEGIFAIPDADIAALRPGDDPRFVRARAAEALLGVLAGETDMAIVSAGAKDRAEILGDQRRSGRGTVWGELRRSIVLFKSFPWSFIRRTLATLQSIDGVNGTGNATANRFAYGVGLFISLSTMGIIANWVKDILNGRDPRYINIFDEDEDARGIAYRNLWAGVLAGGGTGFLGDLLFPASNPGARPQSLAASMSGPTMGFIDDTYQLTLGNLNQALAGEETNAGPEAVRYVQRHAVPNWWYAKTIFERLLFNQAQESMRPGYNEELNERAAATRGTSYWWAPGEAAPARAPDLSRAVEREN